MYLFHLLEHSEEVEAGQLAEVLQTPGAGVQEGDKQLWIVTHVRETHRDPAIMAMRGGSWSW